MLAYPYSVSSWIVNTQGRHSCRHAGQPSLVLFQVRYLVSNCNLRRRRNNVLFSQIGGTGTCFCGFLNGFWISIYKEQMPRTPSKCMKTESMAATTGSGIQDHDTFFWHKKTCQLYIYI